MTINLTEVKEMLGKIGPFKWHMDNDHDVYSEELTNEDGFKDCYKSVCSCHYGSKYTAFIASAPKIVKELVEEVERLEKIPQHQILAEKCRKIVELQDREKALQERCDAMMEVVAGIESEIGVLMYCEETDAEMMSYNDACRDILKSLHRIMEGELTALKGDKV